MPPSARRRPTPVSAPKPQPVHPFDRLYGTDTGGLIPGSALRTGHPSDAHLTAYYAVAPSILHALVDLWLLSKPALPIDRYTFLDIGAGKGRAIMGASLHPFLEVVGVELNPGLAAVARKNVASFAEHASPLAPVTILQGDALETALPSTPTLAFLFHPFESPMMHGLVRRLEGHFAATPGYPLDLVYVNAEHAPVLDGSSSFARHFHGRVPMSAEDHLADLAEIAGQEEYGSTGDEICALYRLQRSSMGGQRTGLSTRPTQRPLKDVKWT